MIRIILTVVVIALAGAGAARAQSYDQLSAWCYGDATDDQTIQGCDAVIASGRVHGNDLAAAYGARAYAYNRKGDYARALVDHDVAIRMNPRDAMLWNNRGWTYNNLRQYERALQDLDEALRLDPRLPAAYNNRGVSYNGMRQYDRAIREYDEAIRLRPGYPVATRNRDIAIRNRDQAGGGVTSVPTPPTPKGPADVNRGGGTDLPKEGMGETRSQ
ncbi:MAG: tetratricopeptide repeat protein [Reyranellaceae bacterium]